MIARRLILALAGSVTTLFGQNAQLSGLVEDPSSLGVSGATVTLRNEQTGGKRVTTSNDSGFYSFFSISPGAYRISVQMPGFEVMIRDGMTISVGERARMDFRLRIGDSRTEVTVRGAPPLMNTEDASVGTVIDREIIDQMPLNGRGIQSLIELTPGVVAVPVADASRGQFAVNGQRTDANYFTLDGMSVNFGVGNPIQLAKNSLGATHSIGQAGGGMLPAIGFLGTFSNLVSPDALQEFKIQTSTFAPEFGRAPGAQIGLITRSGGNRYAGSLFEYFRNDKTDANDWFANQKGLPKAPLRLNTFGGTFGGPLRLPRAQRGQDRTFFFFSLEDLQIAQPQRIAAFAVPTLELRQETVSALGVLLRAFPLPNQRSSPYGDPAATGVSQFAGSFSRRQNQQTLGLRIDHSFVDSLMFFARYNRSPSQRLEPMGDIPWNTQTYRIATEMLTFGLTQTLRPTIVNETRVNLAHQTSAVSTGLQQVAGVESPPQSMIFPAGYSSEDSSVGLLFPPTPGFVIGFQAGDRARQLQLVDHLSYSSGAHQFKFGADYRWFSPVRVGPKSGTLLNFPQVNGSGGVTGDAVPYAVRLVRRQRHVAYIVQSFSAYAQDTWKANRRLTVTYGLRWEIAPAPRVSAGEAKVLTGLSNLNDVSTGHLAPNGKPFYSTVWSNFAPRFGVGWQLFESSGKGTVLRAGWGRFFDLGHAGFGDSGAFTPVEVTRYLNQPLTAIAAGTTSESELTTDTTGVVTTAPGYNLPAVYEWNIAVEQSIGHQTFSAGYVGASGRRLIGYVKLPNPAPYPSVLLLGNNSSSSYHAMQLQFNRRLRSRLRLLLSYTWSHSIDNLSNDTEPALSPVLHLSEYLNPDLNRGSSDFDIRHTFSGAIMALLPGPKSGAAGVLLRNWSANGIFFARTALPTSVTSSDFSVRPDLVSGQPLYLYGRQYPGRKRYNDAAFKDPPPGMQGSLGRNVLRGFGAWQIDLALHRTFRLTEGTDLQFRAEAFNILNHPNFANPRESSNPWHVALRHNPSFGQSTSMLATGLGSTATLGELSPLFQIGGPRSMQFALRLNF